MLLQNRFTAQIVRCLLAFLFTFICFSERSIAIETEAETKTETNQIITSPDKKLDASSPSTNVPPGELSEAFSRALHLLDRSEFNRKQTKYTGLLNFSVLDMLVPYKWGVTLAYRSQNDVVTEVEYLKGSLALPLFLKNLGNITDERISIQRRHFGDRNSFNFFYGVSYFSTKLNLGSEILNRATQSNTFYHKYVMASSFGPHFGVGNRWTFSHDIQFGVDWLAWYQPLIMSSKTDDFLDYSQSANDRRSIRNALNTIKYVPHITILRLQFGMSF